MPSLEFEYPDIIDQGPQPQLVKPLLAVGDELANIHESSDLVRVNVLVPDLFQYRVHRSRRASTLQKSLGILAEAVIDYNLTTNMLQVFRHLRPGDEEDRPWHADPVATNPHLVEGSCWEFEVAHQPHAVETMSVGGPSTLVIAKTVSIDEATTDTITHVTTPAGLSERGANLRAPQLVEDTLLTQSRVILAANGRPLRLPLHQELSIGVDYELQSVAEAHMARLRGDQLHCIPEGVRPGRTLLYTLDGRLDAVE